MTSLCIDGIRIEIVRKKIKRLRLSVHPPDGLVRASAPIAMETAIIRDFATAKAAWIKRQQEQIQKRAIAQPLDFAHGEKILFLGQYYQLAVIPSTGRAEAEIQAHQLVLAVRPGASPENRRKLVEDFYRRQLKLRLPPLISRYEKLAKVRICEFGIKKMKTRWGSCNRQASRIWLNLELASRSPEFLEYVVAHEIAHLKAPGHGKEFKSIMDSILPDWRQRRRRLNSGEI